MYSITTKIKAFGNMYKVPLLLIVALVAVFYLVQVPFLQPQEGQNNTVTPTPQPQASNATSGWILDFNERADGETPNPEDHMYRTVDTEGNYIKDISAAEAKAYKTDPMAFWNLDNDNTETTNVDYSLSSDNNYITRTEYGSKTSTLEVAENNGQTPVFKLLASSNTKNVFLTHLGYLGNNEHLFAYDTFPSDCNDVCSSHQTFYVGKLGETPKEIKAPKNISLTSEGIDTIVSSRYVVINGQIEGGAVQLFVFDRQKNEIEEITKNTIFLVDDIQSWPYVVDKTNGKIYSISKVTSTAYTISSYDIATKKKSIVSIVKPAKKINTLEGETSISMNISPSDSYLYIDYAPTKADGTVFSIFSLASNTVVFTSDTDFYDLAQNLSSWDLSPAKKIAFDTTIYDLTDEANPTVSQLSYIDPIQRPFKSYTVLGYWKR